MQNQVVTFNSHEFQLTAYDGQLWMTSPQIVDALGMADRQGISNIYNRHKDEFEGMTYLPKLGKPRCFNREGAWLIGMFARTPKAAEFRKWVLKVLGTVVDNQVAAVPSLTQDRSALKAIGGIVKKCAAVAVRQEIDKLMSGAEKEQGWEISDSDILYYLHHWHCTRNKDDIVKMQELIRQNDEYRRRLAAVKQAVD